MLTRSDKCKHLLFLTVKNDKLNTMQELIKLLEAAQGEFQGDYALEENGFEAGLQKAIDIVKNYGDLHSVRHFVKNPYAVDPKKMKVGDTYFVFHNKIFYEILIGPVVDIGNMYVDFPDKKGVKVCAMELHSKVPKNYKGKVVRF